MGHRSRLDHGALQVRDCERLPGHHKTYAHGSVIHVMSAGIAPRQSRHHRHQCPCCSWPRECPAGEAASWCAGPRSGFECDAAAAGEHIARLPAICDTSAVQSRKVGRLRWLPGDTG